MDVQGQVRRVHNVPAIRHLSPDHVTTPSSECAKTSSNKTLGRYGKPLVPSRKNPFSILIFLINTFTKQFVDSLVIAVHTNLLAIE